MALSDAETARAGGYRALLESGGGLEAATAARSILDPLSGDAAADVREGFEQQASRALAGAPPGCSGGTGAGDAGLRHVFACLGRQGEETPGERLLIERLFADAAAAQATADAAFAELEALDAAHKEASSEPKPGSSGALEKEQRQARAKEAAATARQKAKQARGLAHRAAFRPTPGVAEEARSAAAAALAFATRAGAIAGIPKAQLAEKRAHACASSAADAAAAAAEKEPRGASAEGPEEESDGESAEDREMAAAEKRVRKAQENYNAVKQN